MSLFAILLFSLRQLNQNMKLKLQFAASVFPHSPQKSTRLSSDAARQLQQQEKQNLARSQSFSHQNPTHSHHTRYNHNHILHFPSYYLVMFLL